jgi:hypothetical protein
MHPTVLIRNKNKVKIKPGGREDLRVFGVRLLA